MYLHIKRMHHSDLNAVNVLVVETTEIVRETDTAMYSVWICVRNGLLVMCAIYYVVVLTLCWWKN